MPKYDDDDGILNRNNMLLLVVQSAHKRWNDMEPKEIYAVLANL